MESIRISFLVALYPGVVKTNFGKESLGIFGFFWMLANPFKITAAEGAKTSIYLAETELSDTLNGAYFKKSKPGNPSKAATSKRMRDKLWKLSEEMVKPWHNQDKFLRD